MQPPDIGIQLNSGWYGAADSEELAEQIRAETGLRVESGLFDYADQGSPFPPEVVLSILYTLFPLQDIYANMLSSMLWEAATGANRRLGRPTSRASFFVRKVDEDGRILKEVRGLTTDPEIIKDLLRRADEPGKLDGHHYFPPMTDEDAEDDNFRYIP